VDPELGERALAALATVADGRGASMAQVALAWVLAQAGITSAIVGASSLEQLDDNLAAADVELTAEELAALDAATALAPIYPAWWDPAMGIPGPTDLLEEDT
jgi:aryl-alcohol dehydrogenase-like predicted oxidoreductase